MPFFITGRPWLNGTGQPGLSLLLIGLGLTVASLLRVDLSLTVPITRAFHCAFGLRLYRWLGHPFITSRSADLASCHSPVGTSGFASWHSGFASWHSGFASWFTTPIIRGVLYRYSGGSPARVPGSLPPVSGQS